MVSWYALAMRDPHGMLAALGRSRFRRRFALGPRERRYLADRGHETVMTHARQFIDQRLAPAAPPNDGRQTPMRGHPVFIAQHATATCCRKCLSRWHDIPAGHALTEPEIAHVLAMIDAWLGEQTKVHA